MILRITDWDKHFENASSRKLKRLDWVAIPNKMDGEGYTALVEHADGAAHLGAWYAIVEVASKQSPRGYLPGGFSQGISGICQSIGRISRLPPRVFMDVIPRLLEIGWLEDCEPNQQDTTTLGESANASAKSANTLGESANVVGDSGILVAAHIRELQDTTLQDSTGKNTHKESARALSPPNGCHASKSYPIDDWAIRLYSRHPKKKDKVLVELALMTAIEKSRQRPDELFHEIDRVHALWCATFQWREQSGRFAPPLANWLGDQGWTAEPTQNISKEEHDLEEYDRRMGKS